MPGPDVPEPTDPDGQPSLDEGDEDIELLVGEELDDPDLIA